MRQYPVRPSALVASFAVILAAPGLTACGPKSERPAPVAVQAPPTTPEPLLALTAPTGLSPAKVILGRRLFHDPVLSGDNTLSCASCHSLDTGGAEHRATSIGIGGHVGPINSPTVLNSSLNFVQFWDGRARTLDEQAAGPIENPGEMGSSIRAVVTELQARPDFVGLFEAAYPDGITGTNLTNAIAEYERSLITVSPFDRFLGSDRRAGDPNAISAQAKRGYETFKSVGCTTCHRGQNIGGSMYQRMGLVRNYFELRGTPLTDADNGRFNVTHAERDRHTFKVPTLRNIALTAPYFHDGSQDSLAGAVKTMGQVQLGRELTDAQVADLVAFLESLTGELPAGARLPPNELHMDGGPMVPPSTGHSGLVPVDPAPQAGTPAPELSGARSATEPATSGPIDPLLHGARPNGHGPAAPPAGS